MTFEHDDVRPRIPRAMGLKLEEIADKENIKGRNAWAILARKVLQDFIDEYEEEEE
jgi:hypothetical protein